MSGNQGGGPGWAPTSSLPLNQWVNQSWTHDKSNTTNVPEFYVNGLPVAASLIGGASSDFTTTVLSPIAIGNRPSDVARGWDGMIGPILFFDGYLSATDHWSLNSNPLQVIRSLRQTLRASVASSTTTISATTADAGGSIISKSTAKTAIAATTANAVGNIASSNAEVCASAITATTANATGSIDSKSTCKTVIAVTTAGVSAAIESGMLPTAILSPVDRGNVFLASSSVVNQTSATPTLNIVPRTMINDWIPGQPLQFHWYGAADNVKGKIPQFKVKFWTSTTHNSSTEIILQATNYPFNIAGGYRPEWSYDGRTWNLFDNCLYDADNLHLRFYNNAAFTQDTVYYSTSTPWQESLTGEWLATLPTTYIQETPSVIAYGGADYVFGQSVPRVNELSEAIDACNLYAFKISSGAGMAPNGKPKRKVILSAGNHAGEDPGNWALKGCVEFLIGTDDKAVTARQWLDFYVYPMLIPAGRRGGHWRSDWEPGKLTYDTNRHWLDGSMSTIESFKTAILADTGGAVASGFSFHSSFPTTTLYTFTDPTGEMAAWVTPITTYVGAAYVPALFNQPGSLNGWTMSGLGARVAFTPEIDANPAADLELYGAGFAKALSDMAATGYFGPFLTDIAATTANAVGSITSKATAKTVIAATTADSVGSIASTGVIAGNGSVTSGTGTGAGTGTGGDATGQIAGVVAGGTGAGAGAGTGGDAVGEVGGSASVTGGTGTGIGSGAGGDATGVIAGVVAGGTGTGVGSGTGGDATGTSANAYVSGGTGTGAGSGTGGDVTGIPAGTVTDAPNGSGPSIIRPQTIRPPNIGGIRI